MTGKSEHKINHLLQMLADGNFHSGEVLARQLGVSRAAVWKLIQTLQQWQLEVYSVRGKGYKIPGGLSLLNQASIQQALSHKLQGSSNLFQEIEVVSSIDSTANYLVQQWRKNPGKGRVCIAEHQTAGRGRKGRPWISPFGANLYFSIGLELPLGLSALGGLSLVIGMALTQSINQLVTSEEQVKIKWPNDLLYQNRKMAGILVEASGESNDSSFLNIGVGINWNMQQTQGHLIDQPWANLTEVIPDSITRNQLLGMLLADLEKDLKQYLHQGFTNFAANWPKLSAYYLQPVVVHTLKGEVSGKEVGIESNGALQVAVDNSVQVFYSGEVSLRALSSKK